MCTLFGGLVTADISHVSYQDGFWDPCVCVCVCGQEAGSSRLVLNLVTAHHLEICVKVTSAHGCTLTGAICHYELVESGITHTFIT